MGNEVNQEKYYQLYQQKKKIKSQLERFDEFYSVLKINLQKNLLVDNQIVQESDFMTVFGEVQEIVGELTNVVMPMVHRHF